MALDLGERAESWAKEQYQNYLATSDRTRLPLDFENLDEMFRQELCAFIKRNRLMIITAELENWRKKQLKQKADLEKCLHYLT